MSVPSWIRQPESWIAKDHVPIVRQVRIVFLNHQGEHPIAERFSFMQRIIQGCIIADTRRDRRLAGASPVAPLVGRWMVTL